MSNKASIQSHKKSGITQDGKPFSKWLLVFSFILISAPILKAQDFNAGLIGGIGSSQVSGDDMAGFHKIGLIFGGFVNRDFGDDIAGQFEIYFIQKGSRDPDGDFRYYKMRLSYLEIPILLKWKQSERITLEVGPALGALVSSSERDVNGKFSFQRPFNRSELSAHLGLYYNMNENWSLNWRVSNSITPIRAHAGNASYLWNRGQYSTIIHLTFRYQFP